MNTELERRLQAAEHINEGYRFLEAEHEKLLRDYHAVRSAANKMAEMMEVCLPFLEAYVSWLQEATSESTGTSFELLDQFIVKGCAGKVFNLKCAITAYQATKPQTHEQTAIKKAD